MGWYQADGRKIEFSGGNIFRFEHGRVVELYQHNYVEAHALYEEGLGRAKELGEVWIGTFLVGVCSSDR